MVTVKELREKEFLSVDELAKRSGVSRSVIYNIESGKHKPIRRTIRKLAKALGVKPSELEPEEQKPPPQAERQKRPGLLRRLVG